MELTPIQNVTLSAFPKVLYLFSLHCSPLEDVIRAHGIDTMMYADDCQLYVIIKLSNRRVSLDQLELCIDDVLRWNTQNGLKYNPPLQKLLYFICILYLFYCYHTYFNPILILSRSILLLFSLIRKIDHLFYCCFASIETLFYKQWSILSLFYYTKSQNSP